MNIVLGNVFSPIRQGTMFYDVLSHHQVPLS